MENKILNILDDLNNAQNKSFSDNIEKRLKDNLKRYIEDLDNVILTDVDLKDKKKFKELIK